MKSCSFCHIGFNDGDIITVTLHPVRSDKAICHIVLPDLFETLNLDESYDCSRRILYSENGAPRMGLFERTTYGVFYDGKIYSSPDINEDISNRDYLIFVPNEVRGVRIEGDLEFLTGYRSFFEVDKKFWTIEELLRIFNGK